MDTSIRDGDYQLDAGGRPQAIDGYQELLQRAMIRLSVKKGSFCYDPELGSRLHSLKFTSGGVESLSREAIQIAREALAPMPEIKLQNAAARITGEGDRLELTVLLTAEGRKSELEVTL